MARAALEYTRQHASASVSFLCVRQWQVLFVERETNAHSALGELSKNPYLCILAGQAPSINLNFEEHL